MANQNNMPLPPSYDMATGSSFAGSSGVSPQMSQGGYQLYNESDVVGQQAYPSDKKGASRSASPPRMAPPQPYPTAITGQPTTVYHYQNPRTGHMITSLLPPNHPEMVCLQAGEHVTKAKFGVIGILAAVFWFPLGVGLCLLDRRVSCRRCGAVIHQGLMDKVRAV